MVSRLNSVVGTLLFQLKYRLFWASERFISNILKKFEISIFKTCSCNLRLQGNFRKLCFWDDLIPFLLLSDIILSLKYTHPSRGAKLHFWKWGFYDWISSSWHHLIDWNTNCSTCLNASLYSWNGIFNGKTNLVSFANCISTTFFQNKKLLILCCCYSWISKKLWKPKIFCRFLLFCKDRSKLVRWWKNPDINDFIQFTFQNERNNFLKIRKNTNSPNFLEPPFLQNLHQNPFSTT